MLWNSWPNLNVYNQGKLCIYLNFLNKLECFKGISTTEKNRITKHKKIIIFQMFEIANQLLACLYLAQWKSGNTFSFLNVNEVGLFLTLRCLCNKIWNFSSCVQFDMLLLCCIYLWDTNLNTWRKLTYPCMAMYYSTFIFMVNCYFTQTYEEYELLNFEEHKQEFQIWNLTVMWQGIDAYNFQAYICCSKWICSF